MAVKASDNIKRYQNPGGPEIGTVSRRVIERDGLVFKDIDGSGQVTAVNDWRLPPEERAAAYVKVLSVKEKIAQLFISDWRMGKYPKASPMSPKNENIIFDESGILDDGEIRNKTIFGEQYLPGTTALIKEWFNRHLILRANPRPEDLADWLNQMHAVAEECGHFVPVQVMSNSRNENGEVVYGMNDASGVFATWPGTLGIAAAVKGTGDMKIVDDFADCVRREWHATGLRKGYMYMADCVTDPRWQRTFGTFGEEPALIAEIFRHLIPGIQGSADGVTAEGVSMTVKHFPGGGARENGFDPHYEAGQWNVYATPGSLEKYHLPAFYPAVECRAASVMPYYSKPAADKSAPQTDGDGTEIRLEPYGFAYNRVFIHDILRGKMGFRGYVNSDTGIVHNMSWGVEMLDVPERIGFAVTQSGVDIISGLFDNEAGMEAYERASNGYYDTHPLPEGIRKEDVVLTDESLNRAVARTLTELFRQGMFEQPYADPENAARVVADASDWENAARVHRQSVVLLKNDGVLPLTAEKLAGKKVYAEAFHKKPEAGAEATKALREMLAGMETGVESGREAGTESGMGTGLELTDNPAQADYCILMVSPSSGEYFNATPGYLELDICEDKEVCNVTPDGRPAPETHRETTLSGAKRIPGIAAAVRANGGKVIANINIPLAWEVGNVERNVDALTVGFDTYPSATLDVIFGRFSPVGKLPITLPRGDQVLAVDGEGVCVSPNDVPGYDKDQYMPDSLKDENGKAYAYRDGAGNYYELGFGLGYE